MELSQIEKAKHLSQWTISFSVKFVEQFNTFYYKTRLHFKNSLFSFTTFAKKLHTI